MSLTFFVFVLHSLKVAESLSIECACTQARVVFILGNDVFSANERIVSMAIL